MITVQSILGSSIMQKKYLINLPLRPLCNKESGLQRGVAFVPGSWEVIQNSWNFLFMVDPWDHN